MLCYMYIFPPIKNVYFWINIGDKNQKIFFTFGEIDALVFLGTKSPAATENIIFWSMTKG